jgi:hypothetical protein
MIVELILVIQLEGTTSYTSELGEYLAFIQGGDSS